MDKVDLSKNSLSNKIAEHITEQIITGELRPGEKLVESLYAEEYGTSRAPIREAFFLLTIEGLVERIPRKGTIVKGYSESEIYDLLEIRVMLESLAMKRIEKQGVDLDIVFKMDCLLDEMRSEKEAAEYTKLNYLFHMHLMQMSKSHIIKKVHSHLEAPLLTIQNMCFEAEGNMAKSLSEHLEMVALLKDKKVKEAADMLEQHNHDLITSIQKLLRNKATF
ncbi:GntR family transcriptional regulator [Domibacillus robiginosus]|uniref:GntR family transcriptional regulator n=1 Tax=Domibacillus robiginosus TaxID=1071054 RepID=UPI00067CEA9A|nr:GntR family transcriptional regulator [Domibacillus robiginosus]